MSLIQPCKCILVCIILFGCVSNSAKILGIIPTASYSHQITFHPLWRELALRGHQVTVITTDPLNDTSLTNLREIHVGEIHTLFKKIRFYQTISGDIKYFWHIAVFLIKLTLDLATLLNENSEIKNIRNEKFDLVIGEAHFPSIVGLIGHFRCPWIGVSSMESGIQYNVAIGNPTHPVLNPDYNLPLEDLENLNFLERVASLLYRSGYVFLINTYLFPALTKIYEDAGINTPSMIEVQNNISMLFVTTHPIFHNTRPVFPNTISIGTGIHIKKPQPLSKFFFDMHPVIIALLLFQIRQLESARILSVIPTAIRSHHIPFQPFWRELALKGHELTVITPNPQRNSIANLKELDTSFCYQIFMNNNAVASMSTESFFNIIAAIERSFNECHDYIFSLPEVQELLSNKKLKFDLLIIEAQLPNMLAFAWRFQCPIIAVASLEPAFQFHDSLGNPVHPLINPDSNLEIGEAHDMNFIDRFKSFFYVNAFRLFINTIIYPRQHALMQKYFGQKLPPLADLQENVSLMLVGTHPLFHNVRPVNLNTISVGGGMHLSSPKSLPNDLQTFLDEGTDGVIYFSLGSNVNSNLLTDHFKQTIMKAFAEVPYKVLLKMDEVLKEVPKNVLVKKWMPQQDILRHKNVKLFITQGGLQSLQEAVINGVPLIGISFFGDQITNVNKMVKKGYGIKIDRRTITKDKLVSAIKEIFQNSRYREMAEMMRDIFKDEEIPSLQRAVYWTEYVIRHKGAKHLRSPAIGMPAWKYYMLDVIGFLLLIFILIIILFYLLIRALLRLLKYVFITLLLGKRKPKVKKN